MGKRAFTLVELMIVVAILGILASIVLPQIQAHTVHSREAAAKDILRTMRTQIELYKFEHNGTAPGYRLGAQAALTFLTQQFIGTSMPDGRTSANPIPTGPYIYGPYLKKLPQNPFNDLSTIAYTPDGTVFSDAVDGTTSGWLYKKETAEFKLNLTGTDSQGVDYHEY